MPEFKRKDLVLVVVSKETDDSIENIDFGLGRVKSIRKKDFIVDYNGKQLIIDRGSDTRTFGDRTYTIEETTREVRDTIRAYKQEKFEQFEQKLAHSMSKFNTMLEV